MSSAATPTFSAEQQLRVDALHIAHGILAGGAGTIVVGSAGLTSGSPAAPRDFDIITDLIELAEYIQTGHELVHYFDEHADQPSMVVHRIDLAALLHTGPGYEALAQQLRDGLPQGVINLIGADESDNLAVRLEVRVEAVGAEPIFMVHLVDDRSGAQLELFAAHPHSIDNNTIPSIAQFVMHSLGHWASHRGLAILEEALSALDDEIFAPGKVKDAGTTPPDVAPEGHIVDPLEQDSTEGEARA